MNWQCKLVMILETTKLLYSLIIGVVCKELTQMDRVLEAAMSASPVIDDSIVVRHFVV